MTLSKRCVAFRAAVMLLILAFVAAWAGHGESKGQVLKTVKPKEAYKIINKNEGSPELMVLDVRTLEEFTQGHLENALNIDFYSETFKDEIAKLDRNNTYVIYCRSGSRSIRALDIMGKLGFMEVYNIGDGFFGWTGEGLPFVK